MTQFFLNIYDFFQRKKRLCWALMVAATCILLAMVASLRYNENILDFMPMGEDEQKAITLYQDISGGQRIIAMFKMKEGDSTDVDRMAEAVDLFAEKMAASPAQKQVGEVTTQVDFDKVSGITDFIYQNMPLMLNQADYDRMEQILASPDSIDSQLANDVQLIMMPATGMFANNIGNDPLGLFGDVMALLQAKQASLPFEMDNGYIFTSGKKYAIAMMTSPYGAMETAGNALLVEQVDSVAKQTMQEIPEVEVALTGSPVIAVGNARQIKADSYWAISIAVTLIVLLLIFSFRKTKHILLIGVAILFGWLFAMGFTAVLRSDVSLIVLAIGSIIIGIAVNYPLHFVAHIDHGGTVRDVLKEMVPPLLIGNITTVGAFASLIPLDAPALRDLGLFAVFMLIGTILFVLIFLPHLVKQRAVAGEEKLSFGRISSISPDKHRWLLWVFLLLTVFFGYFSLKTSFDANMHHVNYMTPEQTQLLGDLTASAGLNDTSNVYLATEGKTWDEALKQRQRMAPMLDSLQAAGKLRKYSDVTHFICSADEQQRRIDLWNAFWDKHRDQAIQAINQHAPQHGFSDDAFTGFVDIISNTYEPHDFDYFETVRSALLTNSFSESTGNCTVVDVIDATQCDIQQLEDTLNERVGKGGYAFDFVGMNSAVARSLSDNFNYIGFACGFIVFVFLWISFGRLELALLAFLPMAMGWIWILGIMYLCGMQFNIVNVILATFIFGQGDDYTIFITDGLINEFAYRKKLLRSYKNSIIISALILFIGMGALIIAKHPALHSLAEVTIVGMFTVVLMAWIVPPLIFGWLTKNEGKVRRSPVTIEQAIRTGYSAVVYITELAYGSLLGLVFKFLPRSPKREAFMRRVVCGSMRANIGHIWGVHYNIHNDHDEKFEKGSIIIANHQSILDPIYMLAINPNILMMISGKVWRNPIAHPLFKLAGFLCLDKPVDQLKTEVSQAIERGYSVVLFPEGERSVERIQRFHKGAFVLAQETGADILPVYLHGLGHVMPKDSAFASRGQIDIFVGERIPASQLPAMGDTYQGIAHNFCAMFKERMKQMKQDIETTHYFHHYVIDKYTYKGADIERETRRLLKRYDDFSQWIDGYQPQGDASSVTILNAGRGQFSLLFALVHPDVQVHSYADDPDDVALAACCDPLPKNLHIHPTGEAPEGTATHTIDLAEILRQ